MTTYNWKSNKVLIVEDDYLNYKFLEIILSRRTQIQIVWAKNGKEAIDMFREHSDVDIILLDLQLPDLDGIEALKIYKKLQPALPVVIQTANAWCDDQAACLENGADDFFTKPIDADSLLVKMEELMEHHQMIRHLMPCDFQCN